MPDTTKKAAAKPRRRAAARPAEPQRFVSFADYHASKKAPAQEETP